MIRNSVNFNHFFFKKLKIINSCPKKPKHQQKKKSKKCVGLRYGSIVKNFTLTFFLKIFSWVLYMHRDSQKKIERKTQCKIFQGGSVKKGFPHILAPKSGALRGDFPLQKQWIWPFELFHRIFCIPNTIYTL